MKIKLPAVFLVLLILLSACPGPEEYPVIPEISFKSVILSDTADALGNPIKKMQLVFFVVDGDGNIGYNEWDTIPPYVGEYRYNCHTTLYEYIDGEIVEAEVEAPYNFRIPYVEPQGQNKLLEADIYLDMDFTTAGGGGLAYDSILFDFYIYDRALNKSNVEQTPIIYLDTLGIFTE